MGLAAAVVSWGYSCSDIIVITIIPLEDRSQPGERSRSQRSSATAHGGLRSRLCSLRLFIEGPTEDALSDSNEPIVSSTIGYSGDCKLHVEAEICDIYRGYT